METDKEKTDDLADYYGCINVKKGRNTFKKCYVPNCDLWCTKMKKGVSQNDC